MIKAIIGLGNEGKEYQNTYHNVGAFGANLFKQWAQKDGFLLRFFPLQGYMNTIGLPIAAFMKQNNLLSKECVVIKDDTDLLLGSYKIVQGGGTAGHKGAESILAQVDSAESFWWLKVGVRDPHEAVRKKAETFVLKLWSKTDQAELERALGKAWEELQQKKLLTSDSVSG